MVNEDKELAAKPKRGRPRSDRVRALVLETALELLHTGDTRALTMENIATHAKVSKATLYRWWSSPSAIAFEGFLEAVSQHLTWTRTGNIRETLLSQATLLMQLFTRTTFGCTIRRVIADAQSNPELQQAFVDNFLTPRRSAAKAALIECMGTGELRADLDLDVMLDLVFDPIYLRLLTRHAPLDEAFAVKLVDTALAGLTPRV
jgi:AcrR family transcriptional regulator